VAQAEGVAQFVGGLVHQAGAQQVLAGEAGETAAVVAAGGEVVNGTGSDDQEQTVVVTEDYVVNLPPGPGDELSLGRGLRQGAQELMRTRQDAGLDDIDVRSSLHGRGKLLAGVSTIKPAIQWSAISKEEGQAALLRGKKKAGRLPLTGPLLLS